MNLFSLPIFCYIYVQFIKIRNNIKILTLAATKPEGKCVLQPQSIKHIDANDNKPNIINLNINKEIDKYLVDSVQNDSIRKRESTFHLVFLAGT